MKINISENIRRLRKENAMTQEQLAEAVGVSFAAVSKWERGAATPELSCIAELADLFGVSVDALLGYEMRSNALRDVTERIRALKNAKDYPAATMEAEKALTRYPNSFDLVYYCGELYELRGIETKDKKVLERAIELLNHAVLLLPQNTDPERGEPQLRTMIARCYIAMERREEGIELLKRYNFGGVHNAQIGNNYASSDAHKPEEAVPYLVKAFVGCFEKLTSTMYGYINYYCRRGEYDAALEATRWLLDYLESIRMAEESPTYVDKLRAALYGSCANLSYLLGRTVKPYLQKAYRLAMAFDASPTYNIYGLKFCFGEIKEATAYDDIGETAMKAVEWQLQENQCGEALLPMWEELKHEA